LKWSTELGQYPHREQKNTEQRLYTSEDPDPTLGFEFIFVRLHTADPIAGRELLEADVRR